MVNIKFQDGQFKTEKKGFVQYDYGQTIKVSGLNFEENQLMFQFIQNGHQVNTLGTKDLAGDFIVEVPNQFLENASNIIVYCFYETELVGQTEKCVVLDVLAREMYGPEDPEEYRDIIAQILERLDELQYEIDHFELTPEQLEYIVEQVEDAIDLTDYYDKEEVNTLLSGKADVDDIPDVSGLATKTELTNGLAEKADKSDTYTKQQVDNLIPDVSGFATKTELSNGLAGKVDSTTYATDMQAVDTALGGKASASDLQTLSGTVTQQGQDITALQNEINGVNTVLDTILNIGGE